MRLSELTSYLSDRHSLTFLLPGGQRVPDHFHVTEVGETTKRFIDCGGTVRSKRVASLQLWSATDYDHRLAGEKLADIIRLAQDQLGLGDLPVEVEYQGERTIETYELAVTDGSLQLTGQQTDCLAKDKCDIPVTSGVSLDAFVSTACTPGGGCC